MATSAYISPSDLIHSIFNQQISHGHLLHLKDCSIYIVGSKTAEPVLEDKIEQGRGGNAKTKWWCLVGTVRDTMLVPSY